MLLFIHSFSGPKAPSSRLLLRPSSPSAPGSRSGRTRLLYRRRRDAHGKRSVHLHNVTVTEAIARPACACEDDFRPFPGKEKTWKKREEKKGTTHILRPSFYNRVALNHIIHVVTIIRPVDHRHHHHHHHLDVHVYPIRIPARALTVTQRVYRLLLYVYIEFKRRFFFRIGRRDVRFSRVRVPVRFLPRPGVFASTRRTRL